MLPYGVIHDTIRQRLRASLLPAPPSKSASATALAHAASLQPNGTWADLPAPLALPLAPGRPPHLERTFVLAQAHRFAAGAIDEPLRRALDFWLSNDPLGADARQNQIVIPRIVGEIALLCDHNLSPGAADKVLEILARSRWANWVAPAGWVERTGIEMLGVARNHLLRGCLENAPTFFDAAFRRVFGEFRQAAPGESGIQSDMTFQTLHGEVATDGLVFLRECALLVALAHGTPWQAPPEAVKLFVAFLLDGQQWLVRQRVVDAQSLNNSLTETVDLEDMALAVQQLAQLGNPPRRSELAAFARRLQGQSEPLFGHRYFWRARQAVHQRPAFCASWRLAASPGADGCTYLLRSGHEYRGLDLRADDPTLPGATGFADVNDPPPEQRGSPRDGTGALSGGVSEGDYGLAATELRRPGLQGKKAWFFFDESVVCLGTGLHSDLPDRRVYTTINRCRLRGPMVAHAPEGSRQLAPGQVHTVPSARTLEHNGVTYVFPTPTALRVTSTAPADDHTNGAACPPAACRFQIDHGVHPRGSSWACVVLPTSDDSDSAARVTEEVGRLEILANTPALQAVRYRELGLLAVVFWEPGTVQLRDGKRAAANRACVLLCREIPGGGTRLSLSNLTGLPATIHVEYGGQCVAFALAGGSDAGRSTHRLL